jgi:hypothetical protein
MLLCQLEEEEAPTVVPEKSGGVHPRLLRNGCELPVFLRHWQQWWSQF